MVKVVLFDVDGVLIDSFKANQTYFSELMQYAGYPQVTEKQYRKMFHLPQLEVIRTLVKKGDEAEVERVRKIAKGDAVKYREDLVRLQPEVKKVLAELQQKYKLGIVSSRVADGIYKLPQLAEVVPFFEVIITYEDTQRHKPDPQPLQLALAELEADPLEAVYIGDAASDIQAAQAAGMKMIVYPEPVPDFTVAATLTSLTDLPRTVESLS